MNKRQLKKKNTEGRILYLYDHFCSIPKVALATYFDRYPKDWTKVKNINQNNYALKAFQKENLSQRLALESSKYNEKIAQIRQGNFLRYLTLKNAKKKLNDVFEKRHVGVWITAELETYNP